jgi:exo-beta-1,3-glucanase (GH17 family)
LPIRAQFAAVHADAVRQRIASAFPGKEILIGEFGWPSEGRMRESALPSSTNRAQVVSEILDLARRENYDELWEQQFVGGSWGLFDSVRRAPKYRPGVRVNDFPL